jgi:hypothetical protein
MNKVTDLDTSRKLEPIMKGVVTEKTWRQWGSVKELLNAKDFPPDSGYDLTPAYSFLDMLGRVPKEVSIKGEKCFLNIRFPGNHFSVGYSTAINKPYTYSRTLRCVTTAWEDINSPTAALARLLLWLDGEGLLPKEGDK